MLTAIERRPLTSNREAQTQALTAGNEVMRSFAPA